MSERLAPGDAVVCTTDCADPKECYDITGVDRPIKGMVYTVESVLSLTSTGRYSITLCGLRSRGVQPDGEACMIGWDANSFRRLPPINIAALLYNILLGNYGQPFGTKEISLYRNEWREIVKEAGQHRKAKW